MFRLSSTPRRGFLTDGKRRRRGSRLAALSALAVATGLALALPSPAQVPNTWSGTWVNSAPDGTFWVFSQSGSGQSVGGVWKGNASSGTLSGNIAGSTLTGTLVNNEASQSASFSITLAPDGHSFSGTFTIVGGSTGQWRSACSGGACLSNVAPPAPPAPAPVVPPGVAPPAPLSPKLLAASAAWGQAGPATVLAPGGGAIVPSPPIARNQREVTTTVAAERLTDFFLAITPVPKPPEPKKATRALCVRAAVVIANEKKKLIGSIEYPGATDDDVLFAFVGSMLVCLDSFKRAEERGLLAAPEPTASAARPSCGVGAVGLTLRVDPKKRTISYQTRRATRRDPLRRLRLSCKRSAGALTLRIRTRSRRTKLRQVIGKRLVLGVYRSAKASGTADVRTTFKRR